MFLHSQKKPHLLWEKNHPGSLLEQEFIPGGMKYNPHMMLQQPHQSNNLHRASVSMLPCN